MGLGGDRCSEDKELSFEAGVIRSFICTRVPEPRGVANFVHQLRLLGDMIRAGGVVVGGLTLDEVEVGPFKVL